MERKNVVREKAFAFAVRIVKLSQRLIKEEREYVISKQIAKSETSIGANIGLCLSLP
ncbi:MAG: four helix bundle protein [Bacteroidota bacterium]